MHVLEAIINNKQLLSDIAKKYGTTSYLYSKNRFIDNLNNVNRALEKDLF